ncbi:MAG: hypothetical protein JW779_07090 [Candidatus Thorarchaeota archaeon]|nr:hypothetical protein [Candidatus Thorarchaeota archaeon]
MSEAKWHPRMAALDCFILLAAAFILLIAFSVLIFEFPLGMETGAALLLITPFAMFIIVAEAARWLTHYIESQQQKTDSTG